MTNIFKLWQKLNKEQNPKMLPGFERENTGVILLCPMIESNKEYLVGQKLIYKKCNS